MAQSLAHKFGQIIGDVLEESMETRLRKFAEEHKLYLDKQGRRLARLGKKVSWVDAHGNKHDLDYVLERGGSEEKLGSPVAFIESAWRRYTKHSRNKAQEIQGAIMPLARTYSNNAPFLGVILGGVFTSGAIQQLKSLGFVVLYFEYEIIKKAFDIVGINAHFEEDTSINEFGQRINQWNLLADEQKIKVADALLQFNDKQVNAFMDALNKAITRNIQAIRILPLHGCSFEYCSLDEAISFIQDYDEKNGKGKIIRYEVQIKYSNGDEIIGDFKEKMHAVGFLNTYK